MIAKPVVIFWSLSFLLTPTGVLQLHPSCWPVFPSLLWCHLQVLPSFLLVLMTQCPGAHAALTADPACLISWFLSAGNFCDAGVNTRELEMQFSWAL